MKIFNFLSLKKVVRDRSTLGFYALGALAFLSGFYQRHLWFTDEVRVGGIVANMLHTGNYLLPHLGGTPFVEKPPLFFLGAALISRAFSDLASMSTLLRLTSVLFALGCLIGTYQFALCLTNKAHAPHRNAKRQARLAAMILISCPGFFFNALTVRVDIALACFVMLGAWTLARVLFEGSTKALYLSALFLALSFLSKGLVGGLFFSILCGTLILCYPESMSNLSKIGVKHFLGACALFLFFILLWVQVLYKNGGQPLFVEWFFRNNIARFLGTSHLGHEKATTFFYYLPKLALDTFPWIFVFCTGTALAFMNLIRHKADKSDNCLLLMSWLPLLALSLAQSKRPVYLLPNLPFLALSTANFIFTRKKIWIKYFCAAFSFLLLFATLLVIYFPTIAHIAKFKAFFLSPHVGNFSLGYALAPFMLIIAALQGRKLINNPPNLLCISLLIFFISFNLSVVRARDESQSAYHKLKRLSYHLRDKKKIALVGFSEAMIGAFTFYNPQINTYTTTQKKWVHDWLTCTPQATPYALVFTPRLHTSMPHSRYNLLIKTHRIYAKSRIFFIELRTLDCA